jgi:mRNA-binding protein PUF3
MVLTGKGPNREQNGHGQNRPHAPVRRVQPIDTASKAATPALTNGQNSPRSSIPSASASTIDEANDSVSSGKTAVEYEEKGCPEVVIEAA